MCSFVRQTYLTYFNSLACLFFVVFLSEFALSLAE